MNDFETSSAIVTGVQATLTGIFVGVLAEWIIVIVACVVIGKEKNRNGFLWGFFLNIIGLIVLAILPPLEPKQQSLHPLPEKHDITGFWGKFFWISIGQFFVIASVFMVLKASGVDLKSFETFQPFLFILAIIIAAIVSRTKD